MNTATADPLVGHLVDERYEVVSRIARGGMATVYLARDRRLDRDVALKIMHPHLAEGASGSAFLSRFRREARAAARLTHPGVVAVYDQGVDGDVSYLTMEYVAGTTLRRAMAQDGTLGLGYTLDVLDRVLDALGAAHRAGLVHRDIKPENVLIDPEGRVKVTDFGLARAVSDATTATTGMVLGTIAYLAPEVIETGTCDARADVYAAGVMAYEMLTGSVPFTGSTAIQVAFQHVNSELPAPSAASGQWLPPAVDELIQTLAARDPGQRPASGEEARALVRQVRLALTDEHLALRLDPPAAPQPASVPTRVAVAQPSPVDTGGTAVLSPEDLAAAGITARPPEPSRAGDTVALRAPASRRRKVLAWTLVVLLVLGGGGAGAAWWFTSGPGAYTRVPAGLAGKTEAQANALLAGAGLAHAAQQRFDDEVPSGAVIGTKPAEGSKVRKDGTVTVLVSKGIEMLTMPSGLVGTPADDAEATLRDAGFSVEPVSVYSDTVARGVVVEVQGADEATVDPGDRVPHTTKIALLVSQGPAPVKVPGVVGQTQSDATKELADQGLEVTVSKETSTSVAKGRVIRQNPVVDTAAHRTDTVAIVVSDGPPMVDLPSTRGKSLSEARRRLEAAKFKVEVRYPQGIHPLNLVYEQSPDGGKGKMAPLGSTVVLNVF